MTDVHVFTLEAANALVPKLNVMVRAQLPTRVDTLVWLCWNYVEPESGRYHALDEGLSSGRPIGQDIRQRLLT